MSRSKMLPTDEERRDAAYDALCDILAGELGDDATHMVGEFAFGRLADCVMDMLAASYKEGYDAGRESRIQ
jgi:hypothetical protein